MNPLVKANVPIAVERSNKFVLPSQHLTTANFMQFNCAFARCIMPGAHGKLDHKTFMRAQPLDKPCLGSAQVKNAAYFVPFRTVWEPFSDFIVDTPHNQPLGTGIIPNVPRINNSDLVDFLIDHASTTTGTPDFVSGGNNYVLDYDGVQYFKILESLGYHINFTKPKDLYYSALPLLSFSKVFMDFYFPQAYAHYGIFATIDGIFQRQVTYDLTKLEIETILSAIHYVGYNDDFYSAIWDNPSGPNAGVGSVNFSLPDLSTLAVGDVVSSASSGVTQLATNGTPIFDSSSNINFSQYIDSSLKALTKYVKRHQLSSFTIDRYLTEFGIALDAAKLKRCVYLGDDQFPFQIGDVMSTADTSSSGGASLGAYAGKGIGYSEGKVFDFSTDEFGYLFVISTIVPDVSYVSGVDRNVFNLTKLDFITGEFDGLGTDVVRKDELLLTNGTDSSFDGAAHDKLFGFAPRYYQWKIPYDRMTGLFRLNSQNTDLNSWSTARLFTPPSNHDNFVHNFDFVLGNDALQYDRIFLGYSSEDPTDPFFVVHRDDLIMYAPMKPLYDDCLFDDEETEKNVSLRVGGVKTN